MTKVENQNVAFGRPGIQPRWTHGAKDGVGTAYAASSQIWFTLWNGIITEVYHPTVDWPQLRDLQYLITDGKTFFHEEKRHLKSKFERLSDHTLGYRCTNSDPEGRYAIVKEIITAPHLAGVLQRTKITGDKAFISKLHLFALCTPHLEVGGWGNNGYIAELDSRKILMAQKDGMWLALAANVPFIRTSCGYVGRSDGWIDLAHNFQMNWEFDHATDGNIALTGELDLESHREFTLGGQGAHSHGAGLASLQSRRVRPARRRWALCWMGPRPRVAAAPRRAGALGTGRGTRRQILRKSD